MSDFLAFLNKCTRFGFSAPSKIVNPIGSWLPSCWHQGPQARCCRQNVRMLQKTAIPFKPHKRDLVSKAPQHLRRWAGNLAARPFGATHALIGQSRWNSGGYRFEDIPQRQLRARSLQTVRREHAVLPTRTASTAIRLRGAALRVRRLQITVCPHGRQDGLIGRGAGERPELACLHRQTSRFVDDGGGRTIVTFGSLLVPPPLVVLAHNDFRPTGRPLFGGCPPSGIERLLMAGECLGEDGSGFVCPPTIVLDDPVRYFGHRLNFLLSFPVSDGRIRPRCGSQRASRPSLA